MDWKYCPCCQDSCTELTEYNVCPKCDLYVSVLHTEIRRQRLLLDSRMVRIKVLLSRLRKRRDGA